MRIEGITPKEIEISEGSSLEAPLSKGQTFIVDRKVAVKLSRFNIVSTPDGKIVFPSLNVVAPQDHPVSIIRGEEEKVLRPHVQYEFGTVEANMRPEVTGLNIGSYALEMEKQGRLYVFTVKSPHPTIDIKFKYNDEHTFVTRQGLINHHRTVQTRLLLGVPAEISGRE